MFLGPVFNAELVTTARRPRYYAIRTLYGLAILFQVYLSYQSIARQYGRGLAGLRIRQMAEFGESIFVGFAILQAVVIVMLTPALVGGTIADERQRKTLHYLLVSDLSGAEIVLGKLAARLLHVGILVALGLPVVSLIGLIGGVDFPILLLSYAGTMTMAYFLAGLSILVSVHSRRPREAISVLYVFVLAWLLMPTMVLAMLPRMAAPWPTVYEWVQPWLGYVAVTSPIYLTSRMGFGSSFAETAAWGIGLQVLYGTAFIALAAARLRAATRGEAARPAWKDKLGSITRRRRWFSRPECGDDAMIWKERYVSRTGGATKAVMVVLALAVVGMVGYAMLDYLTAAFVEARRDGYSNVGPARRDLNVFLRCVSTAAFVLWSLGVASASASGLTSEREEDTWVSLLSTPLSGVEILRAKLIGPAWALRPLAYLMFATWGIGLAFGSVHPYGAIACLIELVVFTWFLSALGTAFSLHSRYSTRSLGLTMGAVIFLNGGYMFCCIPFRSDNMMITAGSSPLIFAWSLLSPQEFHEFSGRHWDQMLGACVLGTLFYAAAANTLTVWLFQSFDEAVERPNRFHGKISPAQQFERHPGPSKEMPYPQELA